MKRQVMVRRAEPADAGVIAEFNLRMAEETENRQLDPAVLGRGVASALRDPALGFYLVAESGGTVVGSLMVTTEWSDWRSGTFWWIQSVYVMPGHRRRGVFRALHEEVRQRAGRSATPVCGIRLYVARNNVTAQKTYAGLGMAETAYKIFEEELS